MSDTVITSTLQGNVLIIETADGSITYDSRFLVAALLIFVAKGNGKIEPEESATMIDLLEEQFSLPSADALELLTTAMNEMDERPELGRSLAELAGTLPEQQQEDIALMALKVIAASGRRDIGEMEQFNAAVDAAKISPEIVHRAFSRYFAETMPGD